MNDHDPADYKADHVADCAAGEHEWWTASGDRRTTCTWCAYTIWAYANDLRAQIEQMEENQ